MSHIDTNNACSSNKRNSEIIIIWRILLDSISALPNLLLNFNRLKTKRHQLHSAYGLKSAALHNIYISHRGGCSVWLSFSLPFSLLRAGVRQCDPRRRRFFQSAGQIGFCVRERRVHWISLLALRPLPGQQVLFANWFLCAHSDCNEACLAPIFKANFVINTV